MEKGLTHDLFAAPDDGPQARVLVLARPDPYPRFRQGYCGPLGIRSLIGAGGGASV